jgi:hypothetical protein
MTALASCPSHFSPSTLGLLSALDRMERTLVAYRERPLRATRMALLAHRDLFRLLGCPDFVRVIESALYPVA